MRMLKNSLKGRSDLNNARNSLVIGASGGIGSAIAAELRVRGSQVTALHRRSTPAIDLLDEGSIASAAEAVASNGPFDLIFVATGALALRETGPEKALRHLNPSHLADIMALNAIGPALVMKHFQNLLTRDSRSVLAVLSARVGSVGDNRLGGWYGYRASKAALNQFMRTAAIEIGRKRKQAIVLTLHPGTVETRLSADFVQGKDIFTPAQSAAQMLDITATATPDMSGGFLDYAGKSIAW